MIYWYTFLMMINEQSSGGRGNWTVNYTSKQSLIFPLFVGLKTLGT